MNQLMDGVNSIVVVLLYFFKSVDCTKFNIIVDHMIGTPGNIKYVVDGINACDDKRYSMRKMRMIGTLEADVSESIMNAHSMVDFASCSLTEEYIYLCDEKERINGVKSCTKSKKREGNKIKEKEIATCKIRMKLRWWE